MSGTNFETIKLHIYYSTKRISLCAKQDGKILIKHENASYGSCFKPLAKTCAGKVFDETVRF